MAWTSTSIFDDRLHREELLRMAALNHRNLSYAREDYDEFRHFYSMSHYDAVVRVYKKWNVWLDSDVERSYRHTLEIEEERLFEERRKAEEKRKTALVESKNQASVMEAKKYILMKAEQKEVEFLTQKELDSILENPQLYGIDEFLSAADVLKGLGNQMLWRKGQAMLAKIEIVIPKPKEKSWTLPQG
jgi:hypothetical protein